MHLAQRGSYATQFLRTTFARILHAMLAHGTLRQCRTVVPYLLQHIEICPHGDAARLAQVSDECLYRCRTTAHAVYSHLCRCRTAQSGGNPLCRIGRALHSLFHQHKLRAAQLFCGCYEVARVCPQRGGVRSDHRKTCRPVKPRHPFASFPARRHILAAVRVGAGKHERGEMFAPHHLTQSSESFFYYVFHKFSLLINRNCKLTKFILINTTCIIYFNPDRHPPPATAYTDDPIATT